MKFWLINTGEQIKSDPGTPRLLRTGVLAQYLVARGHEVTWWNATVNHQEKIQRFSKTTIVHSEEGYRIVLLFGQLYRRNISLTRILSLIRNAKEFKRLAPQLECPDVILCGYPSIELAKAATEYALDNKIPIAIDFRDMWPDIFEENLPQAIRRYSKYLFAHWQRDLTYLVKNATAITGITDSFVDWALQKTKRKRSSFERPFHLAINPQKPEETDIKLAEKFWNDLGVFPSEDKIIGCYPGTLSERLDLITLVNGLKALEEKEKQQLKFVICGRGDLSNKLQEMIRNEPHIIYAGWRNASQIYTLLRRCDFGVIPYCSTRDFVISYPNKLGEYLSAKLPVMTGLKGQTQQLLQDRDIGYYYQEGNPQSVADCFKNMIATREQLGKKRERALKTYESMFDGRQIYPEFCDYLENLATQKTNENL